MQEVWVIKRKRGSSKFIMIGELANPWFSIVFYLWKKPTWKQILLKAASWQQLYGVKWIYVLFQPDEKELT